MRFQWDDLLINEISIRVQDFSRVILDFNELGLQ